MTIILQGAGIDDSTSVTADEPVDQVVIETPVVPDPMINTDEDGVNNLDEIIAVTDLSIDENSLNDQDQIFTHDVISIENYEQILKEAIYYINVSEQVDVPSGVAAFGVTFEAEARETNGEPVSISGDELFLDIIHRDGNMLIRALGSPVGTADVQFSEELDFSIVYFLE